MATNGVDTASDVASTDMDRDTQSSTVVIDPVSTMQAALASFDGLRVDAAIQVVRRQFPPLNTLLMGKSLMFNLIRLHARCC